MSRTVGRCTACKAFQVATEAVVNKNSTTAVVLIRATLVKWLGPRYATSIRLQRHQRHDQRSGTERPNYTPTGLLFDCIQIAKKHCGIFH